VEHVFKRFYPAERFAHPQSLDEESEDDFPLNTEPDHLPGAVPLSLKLERYYTPEELDALALEFRKLVPEDAYSVAELQGYLLKRKLDPKGAVDNLSAWVKDQEEEKAKIEEAKTKRLQAAQKRKAAKALEEKGSAVPKESATQIQSKDNVIVTDEVTHPSGIIEESASPAT
jgi:hypothetical protein